MSQQGRVPDDGRAGISAAYLRSGRIVEVHVRRLAAPDDVEALHLQVKAAVRRAGPGAVICADHRSASLLSWEAADAWSRAIGGSNTGVARVARSGLLLDPANATYNLQIERVVRCARNPVVCLFEELDELRRWVGAALSGDERDALRDLFSGDLPKLAS